MKNFKEYKILIVDDNRDNIVALTALLKDHQFLIDSAQSGNAALKMLQESEYGLVILDVQMPVMDGFEMAGIMKQDPALSHIPIIFLSALATDPEFLKVGLQLGAIDYITKPFDPDLLILKVSNLLNLSFAERKLKNMVQRVEALNQELESVARQALFSFESMFYNSPDVILILDREGTIIDCNKLSFNHGKFLTAELFGKNLQHIPVDFRIADPDINLQEWIREAYNGDNPRRTIEFEINFHGKPSIFVESSLIGIRSGKGEQLLLMSSKDITARKNAEQQLRQANSTLEKYVHDLQQSNDELEQFAYVASHDLQEPLRMVTGFLAQLEKKYQHLLDETAQQYIHFAVDGAVRMRRIILDLLEYSRVGKYDDILEDLPLSEIIDEVCRLHQSLIDEKMAIVKYDHLPVIRGFRSPLLQIFQNLIENALKYSRNNVTPMVEIEALDLDDRWQFKVIDNGIGMEEEYFEKIFIIFQRLHSNDQYAGTGMGLTIVKKIMDNFKGTIRLESEPGKGSTFCLTLPKL